jgi:hypothetical protein
MSALPAMLALGMLSAACSPEADEPTRPSCIELAPTCSPLYEPTFDELFSRTLAPTCGQGGGSCHGADGQKGGLVFADPVEAHALLTASDGPVVPGNAACSEMVVRTHDLGQPWSMPPGQPLLEAERCVIRLWVEQGAKP